MNVFTGETGAGKSIFVNALNLLTGSRLNSDIVGKKGDETKIEGVFSFKPHSHAFKMALEYDFDPREDCIFSRTINTDGRSSYRINRQIVNLGVVRDILRDEIDIHSQFDTAYLRDEKIHLTLLDRFHGQTALISQVKEAYNRTKDLRKQKSDFEQTFLSEIEKDFLTFQLKEVEKLNPSLEEEEKIESQLLELGNYEQNHTHFANAKQLLDQVDAANIYQTITALKNVKSNDELLTETIAMLESSYYQLDEVIYNVAKLIDKDAFDPYEFEALQARSFEYSKIKRKYQMDVAGLIDFINKAKKQLEDFENKQLLLDEFDVKIGKANEEYIDISRKLTVVRQESAQNLKEEIEKQLRDLSLPNAQFEVEFYDKESSLGLEDCRFLITLNKGQVTQPLAKVASGGELSRFMLGMKVIFNRLQHIECVVFDEIDTGISGPIALQVGLKMYELALSCKVLTITHLPAVASCGDAHYVVEKSSDELKTMVKIRKLDQKDRIHELAQMAFTNTNDSSMQAAKELLEQAERAKLNV